MNIIEKRSEKEKRIYECKNCACNQRISDNIANEQHFQELNDGSQNVNTNGENNNKTTGADEIDEKSQDSDDDGESCNSSDSSSSYSLPYLPGKRKRLEKEDISSNESNKKIKTLFSVIRLFGNNLFSYDEDNCLYNNNNSKNNLEDVSVDIFINTFENIKNFLYDGCGNVFQTHPDIFYDSVNVKKLKMYAKDYKKEVSKLILTLRNEMNENEKYKQRLALSQLNVLYFRYDFSYIYADFDGKNQNCKIGVITKTGNFQFLGVLPLPLLKLIHFSFSNEF